MSTEIYVLPRMEKPNHYTYLKEFRVNRCMLFLQRKCTQHKPYRCFNWHFLNQRRRRPVRKRDGTFNYSANKYCTQYDEATGICTIGDKCQYLHKTAGDTERCYHLRYYKTSLCHYGTDSRGFCKKNWLNCAYAHEDHDIRLPVYDINEQKVTENDVDNNVDLSGPRTLNKEQNVINEDPKWQNINYILLNYKTEQCSYYQNCLQGCACPQYHKNRSKRRNPTKFKYRSIPCPYVKHGDIWSDPSDCKNGDSCIYCHTKAEQQFHPGIYKSTKCNDFEQGCCPRGIFCAFAHFDQEIVIARESAAALDSSTDLGDTLTSALPSIGTNSLSSQNGNGDLSECTSSIGWSNKAPDTHFSRSEYNVEQFQIAHKDTLQALLNSIDFEPLLPNIEPQQNYSSMSGPLVYNGYGYSSYINHISFYQPTTTINDDLATVNNMNFSVDKENEPPILNNDLSSSLQTSDLLEKSTPVNTALTEHNINGNFSPVIVSPLKHMQSCMMQKNRYNQQDNLGHSNIVTGNTHDSTCLFGFDTPEPTNAFPISPSNSNEVQRLQEEIFNYRSKLFSLECEKKSQVKSIYKAWQKEVEDLSTKLKIAEQQKYEAIKHNKSLQQEVDLLQGSSYIHGLRSISEIRNVSLFILKSLQSQMKNDLEEIEKVLYLQTATKCMLCGEHNRSVPLRPCNHLVLCNHCVVTIKDCPYCSNPVLSHTYTSITQT